MRSAVSSILSEMSDPSPLCFPDYDQLSSDHRRVPVLVRPIGNDVKTKAFARVFELVSRVSRITVGGEKPEDDDEATSAASSSSSSSSSPSYSLPLEVRYLRQYALENNDWHEFQFHRGIGGVITLGTATKDDIGELVSVHEALRLRYSRTVLCSCLIVLNEGEVEGGGKKDAQQEPRPLPAGSSITHLFEYENWKTLEKYIETDVGNYLQKLFGMLAELRAERLSQDATGKVPLLCAPFERRDFVGLDLESRQNKRRTYARFKKHLGDLSLACGRAREAHGYYTTAADTLRQTGDWLWLANCLEGLAAIAVLVHYPGIQRPTGLRRNSSLQAIQRVKRADSATSPMGQQRQLDSLRVVVSNPTDLVDMFREIVVHYSKYRHAGVIETEACIKAVHVLIEQGNLLFASEFLQNVVFINLQMNDEEKVHRFSALAKLYAEIKFTRKSAFFNRVAAMRCVAPQNPNPDWKLCYQLLFRTLGGYNIDYSCQSNSPSKPGAGSHEQRLREQQQQLGWSTLQIQILQELVGTARRMGDPVAAARHMAFVIQNLDADLTPTEKAELCQQLNVLTAKVPGSSILHTVHDGIILPAVNLYTVPVIERFEPRRLPAALLPVKEARAGGPKGPFLFTPIVGKKARNAVQWVADEIGEVEVEIRNPLRAPVEVTDMTVLHDGAEMDAHPATFSLPELTTATVRLTAVPREAGEVHVLGYSLVVFGMKSQCRLKNVRGAHETSFLVEVCPPIPRIQMATALQDRCVEHKDDGAEVVDLDVFYGERYDFQVGLANVGTIAVGELELRSATTPAKFKNCVSKTDGSGGGAAFSGLKPGDQLDTKFVVDGVASGALGSGKAQKFSLQVIAKYYSAGGSHKSVEEGTGDQKASSGDIFYRKIVQKFNVQMRPSLVVTWWDILPGGSTEECYVILDISNETDSEAELNYGDRKRIAIDSHGTCRIPYPIAKAKPGGGPATPAPSVPSTPEPPLSIADEADMKQTGRLKRYLTEQVRLDWTLPNQGRRGVLCLPNLPLTDSMVATLTSSSVSTQIEINGDAWHGTDLSFDCGRPLTVRLTGENNYASGVRIGYNVGCSYVTTSETHEDAAGAGAGGDGGGSDARESAKTRHALPVSGGNKSALCEPGGSVSRSAIVLPYHPGKVLIKVSCSVTQGIDDSPATPSRDEVFPDIFVVLN